MIRSLLRIVLLLVAGLACVVLLLSCAAVQRKMLYFPSHAGSTQGLAPWIVDGQTIGFAREVSAPRNVWLLIHGNAGQAADRVYALPRFAPDDAVYILEYPGYGQRSGTPSKTSFNRAASEAYRALRQKFPTAPICVAGESIGTGPACALAREPVPPDKIVLVVPFDTLASVASEHFRLLPVRLLLRDNWDNIASLQGYRGRLEIFGAERDSVIPVAHARRLAESVPGATFHSLRGGHNDWANDPTVEIRNR